MTARRVIRKMTWFVVLLIAGSFSAACSAGQRPPVAVPEGARAGDLGPMELCDYQPLGSKNTYAGECGTLTVSENWNDPAAQLIALPVVRIPASGSELLDPVFVLLGGPGTPNLMFPPPEWLLKSHDVILVGYRGAEGSTELQCPGINAVTDRYLGRGFLGDEARREMIQAAEACAKDLKAIGVDLAGYTAEGVVRDLEAARTGLAYDEINLWSESYGTRVAQLYAYLYPQSLNRVMMIGLNTPGHFVYDPQVFDALIEQMSDLCEDDPVCSSRTDDFAADMFRVTHSMPERWLFFPIDPGSIRFGMQFMFFSTSNMPMVSDMILAAADGDPSGLAMLNLMGPFMLPTNLFRMGDFLNKGGTLDLEFYQGLETIELGDSILGAPLSEWIWPMADGWPVDLLDEELRHLQPSDVDMLVVNGNLDFSTPPTALQEIEGFYPNAQVVLLTDFSHTGDVVNLQPEAFKRLVTSYYLTGEADPSLFVHQPLRFDSSIRLPLIAKLFVAVIILLPVLLAGLSFLIIRRFRRRREDAS